MALKLLHQEEYVDRGTSKAAVISKERSILRVIHDHSQRLTRLRIRDSGLIPGSFHQIFVQDKDPVEFSTIFSGTSTAIPGGRTMYTPDFREKNMGDRSRDKFLAWRKSSLRRMSTLYFGFGLILRGKGGR